AVRSSAVDEDGEHRRFAGTFDTFLWVCGMADVLEKINQCQASLFSTRANNYRIQMKLAGGSTAVPPMAVIIQAMIPAQAAGVMMTLNPINGDRSKIAIESTWGLGQLLVDGTTTPDRFLVDKITGEVIEEKIAHKTKMLQANKKRESGTAVVPVPSHLAKASSLTTNELKELCSYGRRLETHFGVPQDIEFATYQNEIYLLQARPETVWAQKQKKVYGLNGRPIDYIVNTLTNFGKT
ncbi:MAG: PEP/pyruvate-binding domain-containing protein, partial [Anaerolineales bacterium]|nr:PEP/pyruvate-binding domain-containing protein [Anaerolineales bacterium]